MEAQKTASSEEFLAALKLHGMLTGNGAITNKTSGSDLVDYFTKCATFRNRPQTDVDASMQKIWEDSPLVALRIIFYLRIVSRKVKGFAPTEAVQKGQGSRDEFRKALIWLHNNHPDALYHNLYLIPGVGCWKDLWQTDVIKVLDKSKVYELVKRGIEDKEYNAPLIAKYLPKFRTKKQATKPRHVELNQWAAGLCKVMGWLQKDYRKFKSNPDFKAHSVQRAMCANQWDAINFNAIPGKLLMNLMNLKGRKDKKSALERHGQIERYTKWLEKQPTAKFTGYIYELFHAAYSAKSLVQKMTFNKQFDGLIELAKKDEGGIKGNVWCALDTSGSMGCQVVPNVSALDICVSLGIYFSTLNEGAFKDHVIMFDSRSETKHLTGTFCDKIDQLRNTSAMGSTNFQSVIDCIVNLRKSSPEIPIADYPQTLIVVSDMNFNPVGGTAETNYTAAMRKLAEVGLPKMKIIWWFVSSGQKSGFPSTIQDEGVTLIGGFDGSVVTLIVGGKTTVVDEKTGQVRQLNAMENMLKALDQQVLKLVEIPEAKKET